MLGLEIAFWAIVLLVGLVAGGCFAIALRALDD